MPPPPSVLAAMQGVSESAQPPNSGGIMMSPQQLMTTFHFVNKQIEERARIIAVIQTNAARRSDAEVEREVMKIQPELDHLKGIMDRLRLVVEKKREEVGHLPPLNAAALPPQHLPDGQIHPAWLMATGHSPHLHAGPPNPGQSMQAGSSSRPQQPRPSLATPQFDVPPSVLDYCSDRSRACIERLRQHKAEEFDLSGYPVSKLAAVLVLLYERAGELRVLLTTRSKSLRSHPGQTALPGGKVDDGDRDVVATAFREAHEEVGLPLDSPAVHPLCTLRPFVSAYKLVVTPVVALLTDLAVLYELNASPEEVERIFEHPLEALLDPHIARKEKLVPIGSSDWPYDSEFHNTSDAQIAWLGNTTYRMHRFRSAGSPIKGLTADILIMAASVAYGREPAYERWGPGHLVEFGETLRMLQQSRELSHEGPPPISTRRTLGVNAGESYLYSPYESPEYTQNT